MRSVVAFVIVASAIARVHAAPLAPPAPRYGLKGRPGVAHADAAFLYVGYRQTTGATNQGASARMLHGDPGLAAEDAHTLAELAVSSADGRQIVEIGWHVDVLVNGDAQPRLFAFHWIDGQPTCYDACGWVQVSSTLAPGMRVTPGTTATYAIERRGDDWWLVFEGEDLGYFPGALWTSAGTAFTQTGHAQWFGEVAAASGQTCTEMGNGVFGSAAGATTMSELALIDAAGTRVPAQAGIDTITEPTFYNIGQTTPTSFAFGGPGARVGCCTPETCADRAAACGSVPDRCGTVRPCGTCEDDGTCLPDFTCGPPAPPRDATDPVDDGGCCEAGGRPSLGPALLVLVVLRRRRVKDRA